MCNYCSIIDLFSKLKAYPLRWLDNNHANWADLQLFWYSKLKLLPDLSALCLMLCSVPFGPHIMLSVMPNILKRMSSKGKHFCNHCSHQVFHEAMTWHYHKLLPICDTDWRKEWRTNKNHDASIKAAAVDKKVRFGMKRRGSLKKSGLWPLSYACLKASVR